MRVLMVVRLCKHWKQGICAPARPTLYCPKARAIGEGMDPGVCCHLPKRTIRVKSIK